MDRSTLAPRAHEIIINRPSTEADDLFAYGPETQAHARALGHLFVVGHTDQDAGAVGYVVSLIAALAKREYYSAHESGDAKHAFARTLRKVNEVVEEFFKTNEVGINVGIFAVAGNTLLVSRLGKFRVLMARESKVIDVLKDVSLFTKEVVQKRRFSSVISGPIQAADRLLAFIPHRALAARERIIREYFGASSPQDISARLTEAGSRNPSFTCSLLWVDIDQVSIPAPEATAPAPTPQLAWTPRQHSTPQVQTAVVHGNEPGSEPQEAPNIIPSEFSHRSRTGAMVQILRNARMVRLQARGKAIFLAVAAVAVIIGAFGLRSALFTSEADQQLRTALAQSARELGEVTSRIALNETAQARSGVLAQLQSLQDIITTHSDDRATDLYASFMEALNQIDKAEPAAVTLAGSIEPSEGSVVMAAMASGSDTIWVLARAPQSNAPVLIQVVAGQVANAQPLEHPADLLIPAPPGLLLADTAARSLMLRGGPAPADLPTPDRILHIAWFGDTAYVLTTSSILKVSDLDTLKPVTKQWLADVSQLAAGAVRIAVDGDLWTLSTDGTLTKYYKGNKVSGTAIGISVTDSHDLITTEDMPFLYITDTRLKRVHVVDKESMSLVRTITFDSQQDLRDIFMGPDYSLYLLATDGKVWKVQ